MQSIHIHGVNGKVVYSTVTKAYDVTNVNSVIVTPAACDVSGVNGVIGYSMAPTVCDFLSVNSDIVVSADATIWEGPSHSVMTDHSIKRKDLEQVTIDAVETQCTSNLGALQNPGEDAKEDWGVGDGDESLLDPAFSIFWEVEQDKDQIKDVQGRLKQSLDFWLNINFINPIKCQH